GVVVIVGILLVVLGAWRLEHTASRRPRHSRLTANSPVLYQAGAGEIGPSGPAAEARHVRLEDDLVRFPRRRAARPVDGAHGPGLPGSRAARRRRARRRLVDDRRHARELLSGWRPGGQAVRARRGPQTGGPLLGGPTRRLPAYGVPARERRGRDLGVGD